MPKRSRTVSSPPPASPAELAETRADWAGPLAPTPAEAGPPDLTPALAYTLHPLASIFPVATEAEYVALRDDIARYGIRTPIVVTPDGSILDGRHRYRAAVELGLPVVPTVLFTGSEEEALALVVSANLHRRHLSESQRAMVAASLVSAGAATQAGAAETLSVSERSVRDAVRVAADPAYAAPVIAGDVAVSAAAKALRAGEAPPTGRGAGAPTPRPVDGDSWSTTDSFLDLVRRVLGEIDLDPATNIAAQARVGAKAYFTAEDDALAPEHRPWRAGKVFMNPPYSHPLVERFVDALLEALEAGTVGEAIVLVNNATDTAWFHRLAERRGALLCFPRGRIRFVNEANEPALSPRDAQAVVYLTADGEAPTGEAGALRFLSVFGEIGLVMEVL